MTEYLWGIALVAPMLLGLWLSRPKDDPSFGETGTVFGYWDELRNKEDK